MKKTTNPRAKREKQKEKPKQEKNASNPLELLIETFSPTFEAFYIPEPKLVFAGGKASVDPKEGIDAYGPFHKARAQKQVKIGIVGLGENIQSALILLQSWERRVSPGLNSKDRAYDPKCFPYFPGNSSDTGFCCEFVSEVGLHRTLRERDFEEALKHQDAREKLRSIVDMFVKECEALDSLEDAPDVVLLCLPENLKKFFGPSGSLSSKQIESSLPKKTNRKLIDEMELTGQLPIPLIFDSDPTDEALEGHFNLHHALKARCMKFNFPIQYIWERTLKKDGLTQDPASVAWNLSSALYYKAGNVPWQIQTMPDNTCFVGISFYKESPERGANTQSSLAQVFGAGDGLVLQGQKAVIDKKRDRRPHLTESGAKDLLERAISRYTEVNRVAPKRVVIHKTSRYWPEELTGFKKALGDIYYVDYVAIDEIPDLRFMRIGHKPPLRGTVVLLEARRYLIYTVGYIPYFKEYPGMKIPRPIEVMEHIGDSTAQDICREILALTKLNWNSCAFANAMPITISFARSVGRILTEVGQECEIKSKYRYYM